jgi:transposase
VVRALTRRDGLRVPSGEPAHTDAKLAALPLSPALAAELAPLRALWAPVNTQIAAADARLAQVADADPVVTQLMTTPGIGPVTAVAFVATLDDVTRFASAHQVAAYLGLTPREYSSGEQQRRGRISKTGNARMRSLLVEANGRAKASAAMRPRRWAIAAAQTRRGAAAGSFVRSTRAEFPENPTAQAVR